MIGNTYFWIIVIIVLFIIKTIADKEITNKKINKIKKELDSNNQNVNIKEYPYKSKLLLTKTEYAFFKELKKITDEKQYMICPKVRLEDFIEVTNKSELLKYRGYIKSRHIDFLICDKNLHILFAIELDDYTHNTDKAKETDEFKNKLFDKIGIKLYRIRVNNNYTETIENIFKNISM